MFQVRQISNARDFSIVADVNAIFSMPQEWDMTDHSKVSGGVAVGWFFQIMSEALSSKRSAQFVEYTYIAQLVSLSGALPSLLVMKILYAVFEIVGNM